MRRMFFAAAVAMSVGLIAAPLTVRADACSNMTLKGTFGFASTVTQTNSEPPAFQEIVGLFQFDGRGGGTYSMTVATSNGWIGYPEPAPLTYSVAPDCTFTFARGENGETYSGVIVANGKELFFIETSGAAFGNAIIHRGHAVRIHGAKQ